MQAIRDAILPARRGMSSSSVGRVDSGQSSGKSAGIGFAWNMGESQMSGWRSMQETCHLVVV